MQAIILVDSSYLWTVATATLFSAHVCVLEKRECANPKWSLVPGLLQLHAADRELEEHVLLYDSEHVDRVWITTCIA